MPETKGHTVNKAQLTSVLIQFSYSPHYDHNNTSNVNRNWASMAKKKSKKDPDLILDFNLLHHEFLHVYCQWDSRSEVTQTQVSIGVVVWPKTIPFMENLQVRVRQWEKEAAKSQPIYRE